MEGDLVGVDLLPRPDGDFVVTIEINGAVEYNAAYSLHGANVFRRTVDALLPDPVSAVA